MEMARGAAEGTSPAQGSSGAREGRSTHAELQRLVKKKKKKKKKKGGGGGGKKLERARCRRAAAQIVASGSREA